MQFEAQFNDEMFTVVIDRENSTATVNGKELPFIMVEETEHRILFRSGNKIYKIDNIGVEGQSVEFSLNGAWKNGTVKNEQELLLEKLGFETHAEASVGILNAPMPGKILDVMVAEGDEVELGQPVAILEAMKMENELKAPCDGTISSVSVSVGTNVEKNQPLLEIEPRG